MGNAELREVFLKSDNFIQGRYLAEITRQLMDELEEERYILQEWRISVYGKSQEEYGRLAQWARKFNLSCHNVRWFIQVPRLYSLYRKSNLVSNFQEMLDNIFLQLFEVTINPSSDPDLFHFLLQVTGFDSVDDESCYE